MDDILNPDREVPKEITVEVKTTMEQVRLIQQLDEEDKQVSGFLPPPGNLLKEPLVSQK